jgi:hypothetical protein
MASAYNARATFVSASGQFLSGVILQIRSADGALLLNATSEGPYLFARLPEGRYHLRASSEGIVEERTIDIRKSRSVDVTFAWPVTGRPGAQG